MMQSARSTRKKKRPPLGRQVRVGRPAHIASLGIRETMPPPLYILDVSGSIYDDPASRGEVAYDTRKP